MAAPPAINGVFAFEASSATLPPAFATVPFDELLRLDELLPRDELLPELARGVFRALDPEFLDRVLLDELDPRELDPLELLELDPLELLEEPFRLLDLFELEPLRVDRLLEDRVFWAIVYRLSWLSRVLASLPYQQRHSHRRCYRTYPLSADFERCKMRCGVVAR